MRRLVGALVAALAATAGLAVAATAQPPSIPAPRFTANPACAHPGWVGAWAMPPSDAQGTPLPAGVTLRELVYPHLGGSQVRVRLSNRFSTNPVVIGAASVGLQGAGPVVVAGSLAALRFAGQPGLTLAPDEEVVSDPVPFTVSALRELSVSIYLTSADPTPTEHLTAEQSTYLATAGDRTADPSGAGFLRTPRTQVPTSSFSSMTILTGLDVLSAASDGAVVALGDSITDGLIVVGAATNARWPDALARRLVAAGIPLSTINAGISGNHVLSDSLSSLFGSSAEHRFTADVGSQARARTVILFEGINDIAMGRSAQDIESGDLRIVALAHAAGLRILLATLTPTGLYGDRGLGVDATQRRLSLNIWIRSQRAADGVLDFDAAVADPRDRTRLAPAFDGGDHLHLSPAGYAALGAAVPLSKLVPAHCITG